MASLREILEGVGLYSIDKNKAIDILENSDEYRDKIRKSALGGVSVDGDPTAIGQYIKAKYAKEQAAMALAQAEAAAAQAQLERGATEVLITSGYNFEGYRIVKYSGYISGDDAIEIDRTGVFDRTSNGKNLTNALVQIRRQALKELREAAYDLGCNAVIGVDFDYLTLEPETIKGNIHYYEPYVVCVTANGNAVVIEKID